DVVSLLVGATEEVRDHLTASRLLVPSVARRNCAKNRLDLAVRLYVEGIKGELQCDTAGGILNVLSAAVDLPIALVGVLLALRHGGGILPLGVAFSLRVLCTGGVLESAGCRASC